MKRSQLRTSLLALTIPTVLFGLFGAAIYIQIRNERLNTALISAVRKNNIAAVRQLLAAGASPNARDSRDNRSFWQRLLDGFYRKPPPAAGQPALIIAILKGSESVVRVLTDARANVNLPDPI